MAGDFLIHGGYAIPLRITKIVGDIATLQGIQVSFDTKLLPFERRVDRSCLKVQPVHTVWKTLEEKVEATSLRATVVKKAYEEWPQGEGIIQRGLVLRKRFQEEVSGYCDVCCLPLGEKHVEHKSSTPGLDFKDSIQRGFDRYSTALKLLDHVEVLAMPLPTAPSRLWLLKQDLVRRISEANSLSTYERLRGVDIGF